MTAVNDVLPELVAAFFGRVRRELHDAPLDGLRFSHLRVLLVLPSEGASVTALAERLGMTKQGCGQFVAQLTETGHVSTEADPHDRRVRRVLRTTTGEHLVEGMTAALAAVEERLASQVGTRRYATFRRVLEEIADGG